MTHQKVDFLEGAVIGERMPAETLTAIATLATLAMPLSGKDARAWRKNMDSSAVQSGAALAQGQRRDSQSANAGVNLARDLEYAFSDVLREEYAPNSAFQHFFIDSSVPEGYEFMRITRLYRSGEVQEISGSETVQVSASVKISAQEERFPIRHYATSTKYSIFQQMADRVRKSNYSQIAEELRAGREILTEHANYRTWYGNPQSGQYGVLNYPWIEKYTLSTAFSDAASWEDVKDALSRFVSRPFIQSKTTQRPDTLLVSPRVYELLYRKTKSSGSSEISVAKWFLENNTSGIRKIDFAHELTGVGPGGYDVMIAYRRDRNSIANNIINPFGRLPLQLMGLTYFNFLYMSHGGVIMRNVLGNVIGYVDATSLV